MPFFLQVCLGLFLLALTVGGLLWFVIRYESALAGIGSRWFGANWRTTLWGSLNNISIFVVTASGSLLAAYANPQVDPNWWFVIKLIPQAWLPWIIGTASVLKLVFGFLHARASKASEVTGGIVRQDAALNVAVPAPPTPPPVPGFPLK